MTENWDVYDKVCKDRFEGIEKKLDNVEKQVTNDIPHKIDSMFWKFLGISLTISGIIVAIIRLIG